METLRNLKNEFEQEFQTTKNFLERYPDSLNEYAPHKKSMKMMPLATHIAEIFGWPAFIMKSDKLDFAAGDYQPVFLKTKSELMQKLEDDYQQTKTTFADTNEEDLDGRWTMNMGEQVIADFSKYGAMRHALNQITHHRAQLGVYYRLNDITLPDSYGPSADTDTGKY